VRKGDLRAEEIPFVRVGLIASGGELRRIQPQPNLASQRRALGMTGVLDIGILLVVLLSLLGGFRSGFLESIFSFAAWLVGALVAFYGWRPVLEHLPARMRGLPGAPILVGVLVFLALFFLIRLVGLMITGDGKPGAPPIDRLLGAVFGLARGLFLAATLASFLVAYLPSQSRVVRGSRALPLLAPVGRIVAGMAPGYLHSKMEAGWDRLGGVSGEDHGGAVPI